MESSSIGEVVDVDGYVPNTSIEVTRKPNDGKQVLSDGTIAPKLLVLVQCSHKYNPDETCGGAQVINAYLGPVRCSGPTEKPHPLRFMDPVSLFS